MKRYYFKDDSWWDRPECDCCSPTLMQCYTLDTTRLPEGCEDFKENGSSHSIEHCMVQVLNYHGVIDDQEDWRGYHGLDNYEEEWEWLLDKMQECGLQVAVEDENGKWEYFP